MSEKTMSFKPQCITTAIGSLPHSNADFACDLILKTVPEIPLWPQLPSITYKEGMEIQYSQGWPCVIFDDDKQRMHFDTSGDITSELETFYEYYMVDNLDHFQISPEFGHGIYAMENKLKEKKPSSLRYFKNQVTGPLTTGLGRVDENKRAIYYNEIFRDVLVKCAEMKARWLLQRFKFLGCPQFCFIDEPILSAFGSSTYVSIQRAEVVSHLNDVIRAIHKEDALAGAHCCGNTEWTILIDAGVDIISFDAYGFGETISYYPEKVQAFLQKEGVLAWGIVPTSEAILQETPESLAEKLENAIKKLSEKGIDESLIWQQCLITPSCGTGSLSVELAEKVLVMLKNLGQLLHKG